MAVLADFLADYSRLWLIRQTYFYSRSQASTPRHQGRETPAHARTPTVLARWTLALPILTSKAL
jgi:hypothetical protein